MSSAECERPVAIDAAGNLYPLVSADAVYPHDGLRDLIFRHPECLPGGERLVPICTGLPTAAGPIDALYLTAAGDIVLAETGRWRNARGFAAAAAAALERAECLFALDYARLETAALNAMAEAVRPLCLYALFADAAEDTAFIAAVSRNLRERRATVAMAGSGLDADAAGLADLMPRRANLTLALAALRLYRLPNGILVLPRLLARAETVSKIFVRVEGGAADLSRGPWRRG
jgi:hypothetical protein